MLLAGDSHEDPGPFSPASGGPVSVAPYFVEVPDALAAVATIEKDSKRFPDTHGWAYGNFNYNAASKTFAPQENDAKCGYACHTKVAAQDYIYTHYPLR